MVIRNHITALQTVNHTNKNNHRLMKNLEKLASGSRINRAGDDAAGLAISQKMRMQITGLDKTVENAQDGMALIATAEGALHEVHDMLNRMSFLSTQAANGTYAQGDREKLDREFQTLKTEINRVSLATQFNGKKLFQPKDTTTFSADFFSLQQAKGRDPSLVGAVGIANTGNKVADKLANEIIPNAVNQVLKAFPTLAATMGADQIEIGLTIYSAPNSSVVAAARASYKNVPGSKPIQLAIQVNVAKFPDEASLDSGRNAEELKSTILHEVMHTFMQYTLPDGMDPNRGQQYPKWFFEGIAQAAGGGFTGGWNRWLSNPNIGLQFGILDGEDAIKKWKLTDGQYGAYAQGYLATMYLGYVAAGRPKDITASSIASGLDKILGELAKGKSFDQALQSTTGFTQARLESIFGNPRPTDPEFRKMGTFVDNLTTKVGLDGAGAVAGKGDLDTKAKDLVSTNKLTQSPFYVGKINIKETNKPDKIIDLYDPAQNQPPAGFVPPPPKPPAPKPPAPIPPAPPVPPNPVIPPAPQPQPQPGGGGQNPAPPVVPPQPPQVPGSIRIKLGLGEADYLDIERYEISTQTLQLDPIDLLTQNKAAESIDVIRQAIDDVSSIRSTYGALYNRLEHSVANLENTMENTMQARSRIQDTDMAKEMTQYTKNQILLQASQSILAQANMISKNVLQMLQ